jgi:sugar/nucleoside kinase (ribokinase family)
VACDLLVSGVLSADVVFTGLPEWPALGRDVRAGGVSVDAGSQFIVAAAARRLGLEVGYCAVTGCDLWSVMVRERFAAERLSVEYLGEVDDPLVVSVVLNYAGDRGFVTHWSAIERIERLTAERTLAAIDAGAGHHLQMLLNGTVGELAPAARRRGLTVSVDTWMWEEWLRSERIWQLAALADILFTNELEARAMTGEDDLHGALGRLGEACPYVVVKRGPEGAVALLRGELFESGTVPVEAVDATGAGDCFTAGFLYGYLRGLPSAACLSLGNICGGRSVSAAGGYQGSPTETELLAEAKLRGLALRPRHHGVQ